MRAAVFVEPGKIEITERPDPQIAKPTDAIVRVALACVCGSDLWFYRGQTPYEAGRPVGHEFIGVVEDIGSEVSRLHKGDVVIAPFAFSDGTCPHCQAGITTSCLHGGFWASGGMDGGQGEAVRVPFADATLVRIPGSGHSEEMWHSLLALSDVMGTGHHAAVSAGVKRGNAVAVVGDGAVGLSAVLAAARLGADRIIALSRHEDRQQVARAFGATDIVAERGEAATEAVIDLTDDVGADAVLECVGTGQSMATAFSIARPGAMVGYVGVPHGVEVPLQSMFFRNVGMHGGSAPVRTYIPGLMEDVLAGRIDPGRVLDFETDLDGIQEAYAAMDQRRAIKSLVRVSSI
jgi:threonine dehydrogenase-like Zn-dependent dehydrogenase